MTILKSLTFTELPDNHTNPIMDRRSKLVERLQNQLEVFKNPKFTTKSHRWVTNDEGQRVRVEIQKPVKPWWFEDAKGEFFMTVRMGNRKIEFEKGKPAIKVGPKDQIEPLISNLIVATQNGELDQLLAKPQTSSK